MGLNPALANLFNNFVGGNGDFYAYRLYTITLFGGGIIRYADSDFDIKALSSNPAVNGFTYSSGGVRIDNLNSKTQAHWKLGLDTDTWQVIFAPRPVDVVTGQQFPDMIGNVPWLQAAQGGSLDAADTQVDEAYFSTLPTWPMPPGGAVPVGSKTVFAGKIAEVDCTNTAAVLTINDYRDLCSIQMPLHFFQAQCRHMLFDAGCSASGGPQAANFAINGTVAAGSTQAIIIGAGLPAPQGSGTYNLGRVVFTSGLNATYQRTIKSWDGSFTLSLLNPLPFTVSPGDTFQVFPGCDKQFTTCGLFNNTANFGGQPNIPPPESQV